MKKKLIVLAGSLLIVSLPFFVKTQSAYAACECLREAPPGLGPWYDTQGMSIPSEGYGIWRTTPIGAANPADQEPRCPAPGCAPNAKDVVTPLCENKACNVCTQGFVRSFFRVPTLGDLIGNIIRLMFFIAGLYALVLLLLGGFEWVSSGGDDKKLTSARGKIFNAIIGLVVMVAVLTLVIVLEQVVFGGKVCLGVSCPINMGHLSIIK